MTERYRPLPRGQDPRYRARQPERIEPHRRARRWPWRAASLTLVSFSLSVVMVSSATWPRGWPLAILLAVFGVGGSWCSALLWVLGDERR